MLVLHPGHDGEVFVQRVVEAVFWDLHRIALAIKVEHLVTFLAVVGGQVLGPGSGQTGGGKEVHTAVIGTCQNKTKLNCTINSVIIVIVQYNNIVTANPSFIIILSILEFFL